MEYSLQFINDKLKEVLNILRNNPNINLDFFDKYVWNLKAKEIKDNTIVIVCKNNFAKLVITTNFLNNINLFLKQILNQDFKLELITENEEKLSSAGINIKNTKSAYGIKSSLNFDNYFQSNFNKSAVVAAKALITEKYINPIFICSNVGLGKTHLLHAIGNLYSSYFQDKKIKYVSADDFSREVYNSLYSENKNEIEDLKTKYEQYDLLLIDDVQFLANKYKTNEILFSIFNSLIKNNKLVIWTADKNPDSIKGFDERMKSRFHSGLFISIDKPDQEALKEILKIKLKQRNLFLNDDSVSYLVKRNTNGDIRRLEGEINQISFFSKNNLHSNEIITLDAIKNIFANQTSDEINKFGYDIDPSLIIDQVAFNYGLKAEQLKSKSRIKTFILPRWVAMYVLRKKFNMTFNQIGYYFSGRDHSTVKSGIESVEKQIKTNKDLKRFMDNFINNI